MFQIARQKAKVFLKEGTLDVKPILLFVKIRSMAAANFSPCRSFDLNSIYYC
jgi:hypothetical protein